MAKHVFRLGFYGSLTHEGEFIKETAQTVFYRGTFFRRERESRLGKASALVIETDNPAVVVAAYESGWSVHRAEIRALENQLQALRERQKESALQAALSQEPAK